MGHNNSLFSKCTETDDFEGFSGSNLEGGGGKGARIGLIFSQGPYPLITGVYDEG